jgi:hypothetical protein
MPAAAVRTVEPPELIDPARWPKKPYCADDLADGVCIRALQSALKRPYIQANPPHLRIWSIYDIDRPGAALAWEDARLPCPSWIAVNLENLHGHLVWGLSAPVLVDSPDLRQKPLRYLCAVEAAFRAQMEADQGYSGLLTKNPTHERWRVLRGPRIGYTLEELAGCFDAGELSRHVAKSKKPEEVGLGRNVTLFDWLRHWAYVAIRRYRTARNQFPQWQAECYEKSLGRNGDFARPLDSRECYHIAKSVSRWTWRKDAEAQARFLARQAAKGRKGGVASGKARLAASEDLRTSARLMAAQGMTQVAIATELDVHVNTVAGWLKANPQ